MLSSPFVHHLPTLPMLSHAEPGDATDQPPLLHVCFCRAGACTDDPLQGCAELGGTEPGAGEGESVERGESHTIGMESQRSRLADQRGRCRLILSQEKFAAYFLHRAGMTDG
jgi:hypothetical protein